MAKSSRALAAIMILLSVSALCGCGKEYFCDVPVGDATCQIDPNSPLYPGLNTMSSYEYIYGGHQGIVVIRTAWDEFVAYERTCPHDHELLEMDEAYGNLVLACPECGSKFSTFGDGFPLDGSLTSCPLYQYPTYYDGLLLHISNY